MSFRDGKNVPGSQSPYTVWLKAGGSVVGVDYRELNKYIREYNKKHYNRYFDFWAWYSSEESGAMLFTLTDSPWYGMIIIPIWNVYSL